MRQLAARVLADEGDLAVARRILAGDTELPAGPPFLTVMLELLQGELALAAGDAAAAAAHIEALADHGWNAQRRLLAADLAMRAGRPQDVRDLLAPVLHPAASSAPRAEACAAAAVAVELALDLSAPDDLDVELVRRRVRDLLSRTAPQRLIRVFAPLLANPLFLPILRHEAHAPAPHPFARDVLQALTRVAATTATPVSPPHQPRPAVHTAHPPVPPAPRDRRGRPQPDDRLRAAPVPALTPREQDVLGRLARGEEYVDIAQHLYITQNTVKTHVASLYRKLNVGRRSQALRAARDLGLLTEVGAVSPAPGESPRSSRRVPAPLVEVGLIRQGERAGPRA